MHPKLRDRCAPQAAGDLTRPLARLLELGLLRRDVPWGATERGNKRSSYRIADPFMAFWYRFVEPSRSRLAAGQVAGVLADVRQRWPIHLGGVWETLARDAVARGTGMGEPWLPPQRWWGPGTNRAPLELDLVARHAVEPRRVLIGEVKRQLNPAEVPRTLHELDEETRRCPALAGAHIECRLWVLEGCSQGTPGVITGTEALGLAARK